MIPILRNFTWREPGGGIELISSGLNWDLHNFAELTEVGMDSLASTISLTWRVPDVENPWGCEENKAIGCALIFNGVFFLRMTPFHSLNQLRQLYGVYRVAPSSSQTPSAADQRITSDEAAFDLTHFYFVFEDEAEVEIGAESVELKPIWV